MHRPSLYLLLLAALPLSGQTLTAQQPRAGTIGQYTPPRDWPLRQHAFDLLHQRMDVSFDMARRLVTGSVRTRLVVTARTEVIDVESLSDEVKAPRAVGLSVKQERRRSVGDSLYNMVVEEGQSFWTAVYPLYMRRDITREQIRDLVRRGLRETRGNYKIVARLFNMEPTDYKRFLNFLRKHECQLPFHEFR